MKTFIFMLAMAFGVGFLLGDMHGFIGALSVVDGLE